MAANNAENARSTSPDPRRQSSFAWYWIVLWVVATAVLILQILAGAPGWRLLVALAFMLLAAWRATVFLQRSDIGERSRPSAAVTTAGPEGSFSQRLDWMQQQPNFHRAWLYCLLMAVLLSVAALVCLGAGISDGNAVLIGLGVVWLIPASFFGMITWRTRAH